MGLKAKHAKPIGTSIPKSDLTKYYNIARGKARNIIHEILADRPSLIKASRSDVETFTDIGELVNDNTITIGSTFKSLDKKYLATLNRYLRKHGLKLRVKTGVNKLFVELIYTEFGDIMGLEVKMEYTVDEYSISLNTVYP